VSTTKELQVQDFPKKFPCGEIHVKIADHIHTLVDINGILWIEKRIRSSDDIMEICMLVDAIRRYYGYTPAPNIGLRIPYVPYSRQDRVMVPGESLSIKVFADLINSLKFDEVVIWDPHSDVTPALINNCKVIPQEDLLMATFAGRTQTNLSEYVLISPDAGARKKILKVAERAGIKQIIYADKVRDVSTGKIRGTTIDYGQFKFEQDTKFLVVDDLIEYGTTFTEIAKALSRSMIGLRYTIDLHITHGFFPGGLDLLKTYFDNISCANLMNATLRDDIRLTHYTSV